MEKVKVFVERGADGLFSAYMDKYDVPCGLMGFGSSAKEAVEDFYEAYAEAKELAQQKGKTMPELEFSFIYDVASFLNLHEGILSKSGLEQITGINQKQLWHYYSGTRKPKSSTVQKIQQHLHDFADTLKQVQFA